MPDFQVLCFNNKGSIQLSTDFANVFAWIKQHQNEKKNKDYTDTRMHKHTHTHKPKELACKIYVVYLFLLITHESLW